MLSCVTGCSPPPSPEARGASTPAPAKTPDEAAAPTPAAEPAPPANTPCADLDECRARCEAKQARACASAAEGLERQWAFSLDEQASLYERGCELGDANACAALGVLVQDGRGRPHDDAKARQIYEQACDDGSGVACFNLALMYRSGNGAPIDDAKATALLAKAVPHYQAACDAGELEWCMNLGFVYEHGYAGEPDIKRAESIYQKACTAGHANSCVNLSLLWLDQGTSPDTALGQLEKACEEDSGLACGALGHVYLKPAPAVTRDPARASTLLEKGCQLGDGRGCTLLAGMLSLGDDLPTDRERAQTLYGSILKAARPDS